MVRTFSAADLLEYRDLSGDTNPAFGDPLRLPQGRGVAVRHRARQPRPYPALQVPGALLGGLFSFLLGTRLPGRGTNWLKQRLTFPALCYAGQEVTARVEIVRLRPAKDLVNLNTEKGATLAREAIEKDGAEILLGVPSSPTALAVGGIAAQNKKVYIAGPAASDAITGANFNPYVFRCGRQNTQDALTMGAALVKLGENFIQISQDNAFGQGSAASFYKVVKDAGGKFPVNDDAKGVGTIFAPPDTTDFTPYINQILDSKADALIVTWSGAGFVPMFQQMTQMGVFDQMDVATGMGDNQTLAKGYADAVNSVGVSVYHYSLFDTPENKYLTDEHIKRFTVPPDLWAEAGFNCAVMVKQALEATKGDTDGDKLIAALEGMKFEGPKGNYEVRASDHALLQPMTLVKLTNTTDPAFKFFDLVTLFQPEETAPPCAVPAEQGRCK